MKKFLALMLSVLLVLTLVPVMAVEEPQLVIEMFDSVPDTWDGAYIEIYANGQLWQTVEKGNGEESQTETFPYDPDVVYEFYWIQGGYDQEISFTISFGGVEQYSCENAESELLDGALFLEYWENPCEHSFADGSCLCTECGRTCGEDFPHDFSEEHVCNICAFACGTEETPHDWSNKDGVCGVCAHVCPGHEYVDNVCVLCGLPKSIVIQMEDSALDTWDGAYIEIYADGELWQTVKKEDAGSRETASYPYDPEVQYDFYWFSGEFDQEITFTISFAGVEQFSLSSADEELTDGGKFFSYWENPCEHSFADGSCLCTECGRTCGEDFPHEFSEEHICGICSYACGSEETPHDWSKKDGICGVCAAACPGHEFVDHMCSICGRSKDAKVIVGDEETVYITLEEAVTATLEEESATVQLLSNIARADNSGVPTIATGNVTVDLNGHSYTVTNEVQSAFVVDRGAKLTITDNSQTKSGSIISESVSLMVLGEGKLYVKGGTVTSKSYEAVFLNSSSGELHMEGGVLSCESVNAINNHGGLVRISGGVLNAPYYGNSISCYGTDWTLDVSAYDRAGELTLYIGEAVSKDKIKLPIGYAIGLYGELVAGDTLEGGDIYLPCVVTGAWAYGLYTYIKLETAGDYVAIFADYENGELVDAKAVPFTGAVGDNEVENGLELEEGDVIYLFNSLTDFQPVAMPYVVPEQIGQ